MKKWLLTVSVVALGLISITSAQYSSELQSAYDYAHGVGITTMSSIDDANMQGNLIRSHMAKMMTQYATNVLGLTPDTSKTCNFTDIENVSTELQGYIIQSCQLGLMGVGITAFNPTTIVTRAQFGTVLSRALYGDFYNDGSPYYIFHLQALNDAGIMKNISDPSEVEVRGYVMLMMMRSAGNIQTTPSQCEDSAVQIACLIGASNCPSECQSNNDTDTTGTLQVSKQSLAIGTIPANTKYIGSIKFTATKGDIVLKTISLQKVGTFTGGRIEDDGINVAMIQTSSTDTSTTITFSPNIKISQGESKTLSVFVESNSSSDQGIILANNKNITTSADTVSGDFPIRIVK